MAVETSPRPGTRFAELDVSISAEGAATVVRLRGVADIGTTPFLAEELARITTGGEGGVVVDLAQTSFMDTGALRAVMEAREILAAGGRQLTLRSPSRNVARLVTVFGLGHLVGP
jgi:anti-anti-sigma factor